VFNIPYRRESSIHGGYSSEINKRYGLKIARLGRKLSFDWLFLPARLDPNGVDWTAMDRTSKAAMRF
jgi:hypothetical protein